MRGTQRWPLTVATVGHLRWNATVATKRWPLTVATVQRLFTETQARKGIFFGSKKLGLGLNVLSLAQTVKPSSNLKPGLNIFELGLGA